MNSNSVESRELDVLLEEVLGGAAPPDLAREILRRRERAGPARLDADQSPPPRPALLITAALAAAVALGIVWLRGGQHPTSDRGPRDGVGAQPPRAVGDDVLRRLGIERIVEVRSAADVAAAPDDTLAIRGDGAWYKSTLDDALLAAIAKRFPRLRYLDASQSNVSDDGLAVLAGLRELAYLDVRDGSVGDPGIAQLANVPSLRVLRAGSHHESVEDLTDAALTTLGRLPRLERLELPFCLEITDAGIARLAASKTLRGLNIDYALKVGDAGYAALAAASTLEELRHRALNESRDLSDVGVRALAVLRGLTVLETGAGRGVTGAAFEPFRNHPRLRVVSVSGCAALDDDALRHLATCPQLEALTLNQCGGITDDGIAALTNLPRLRRFMMSRRGLTGITDRSLRSLGRIETLEVLDVSYCKGVTNDGARALAGLTKLRTLALGANTRIDDAGVEALLSLPALETLILDYLSITDRTLERLQACRGLTTLRLRWCEKITSSAVKRLSEALPDCRIEREP